MKLSISALFNGRSAAPVTKAAVPMPNAPELPRLASLSGACEMAKVTLMPEQSFRRALNLERKRTERSRKPFILALLNLKRAREMNGDYQRSVQQIVSSVAAFMRETDVIGWYQNDEVLGAIFTELGKAADVQGAIKSITGKLMVAIEAHAGSGRTTLIDVSCHVFPDGWGTARLGGMDSVFYPEPSVTSGWLQSTTKRTIDVAGSISALLLFLPVLVIVAVLVKLTSKGPVLFRQLRVGQYGKKFTFLKFRSMYVDNSSTIHERYVKDLIAGRNGAGENGVFKLQNDPRITPVGRLLRKTSIDEVPQFWNVLKGNMSLVGPRPPLPYEVDAYELWHRRRLLRAKPGITGLWQVTGRSRTTFDEMVRLDLCYTESSSLWLDTKILLQTPRAVLAGTGAY